MSASPTIVLLQALAAVDDSIITLDATLASSDGRLKKIAGERTSIGTVRDSITARRTEETGKLRALDEDLRGLARQTEVARDRQFRVHKLADVQTAESEREDLLRLTRDKRVELEHQSTVLASISAEFEVLEERERVLDAELSGDGGRYASTAGEANTERTAKLGERQAIEAQLPVPLFRKYEQVRERRGNALARAFAGRCDSCQMALPPTFFQKLRREGLVEQCPSCQRLIYYAASD